MKKSTKIIIAVVLLGVVVSASVWGLWYKGDIEVGQAQDCSAVADPWDRRDCYSNDRSARIMNWAIRTNRPELCRDIEHVFIPHDVISDIDEGIIGTVVEGEDAIALCTRQVESGRMPMGG